MIVFDLESPILAAETSSENTDIVPKQSVVVTQARSSTPTTGRRQVLTRRRRKGRVVKTAKTKSVSFATGPVQGSVAVDVYEYDEHDDYDPTAVHSQDYEMQQCRENCLQAVRTMNKVAPDYRKQIVRIFRTRNFQYTQDDLDMLGGSLCRGLERKLGKIFSSHRRWAVDGLVHMQDSNDDECMRFFSKRASQPCVNFARLLALADRKVADEIYAQDNDHASLYSDSSNYWSDSSRSLESTDSIDTVQWGTKTTCFVCNI